MLKHVFLIDVSRHIGLVQHVVNAAQAYAADFKPELIEWFVKPAQDVTGVDGVQIHRVSYGVSPWLSMKARIDELARNGSSDLVFHVLSYDGQVLGAASKLSSQTLAISSFSLTALPKGARTTEPTFTIESSAQPFVSAGSSRGIPLADAIELTKKLLADRGYDSPDTPLKQLFLRRLLSDQDPRARKNPSDPASVSLVSNIVDDGLAKGWLGRSRQNGRSGTERIWLIRAGATKFSAERTATTTPAAASVAGSPVPTDASLSTSVPVVEKGHERTVQMQKCLKNRFIYSPKLVRDYIFSALRSEMGALASNPVTLSQLVRQASTKAEQLAANEGVNYDFWGSASGGVLENLVAAGALLDENKATIKPGPHARGTKVYELQADFEDRCEAYLLEYLITALGDVTWPRDRTAIAHALFKVGPSRKEVYELQEKVDELLVRLRDRVVEQKGGLLVVQP